MEAIGSGASLLAFITLALQSPKHVYKTVSSIRDGPKEVQNLASALADLQNALQQLSDARILGQQNTPRGPSELGRLVGECKSVADECGRKLSKCKTLRTTTDWEEHGRGSGRF